MYKLLPRCSMAYISKQNFTAAHVNFNGYWNVRERAHKILKRKILNQIKNHKVDHVGTILSHNKRLYLTRIEIPFRWDSKHHFFGHLNLRVSAPKFLKKFMFENSWTVKFTHFYKHVDFSVKAFAKHKLCLWKTTKAFTFLKSARIPALFICLFYFFKGFG